MKSKKKRFIYYESESPEFSNWLQNDKENTKMEMDSKSHHNYHKKEVITELINHRFIPINSHSFYLNVERELFYKYYFYYPLEYQQGSRTLYRQIQDCYEKWKDLFPLPSDWIEGKWKRMYYELPAPKQEEDLGELSEHTCKKCHKKGQVRTKTAQIRSFDESATLFCTCTNPQCGHKWKE